MRRIALIVAGGQGIRMNTSIAKQFLNLNESPILIHTLKKFLDFDEIILVLPKSEFEYWSKLCLKYNFNQPHKIVEGGKTRFTSVKNGLKKITDSNAIIAIHDGVRPLISKKLIAELISSVENGLGVVPVVPIKNSIREIKNGKSLNLNRSNLYSVQTPQCFLVSEIKTAYKNASSDKFTDDASVFEESSGKIKTVLGEEKNIKITTQEDLLIAELFNQ